MLSFDLNTENQRQARKTESNQTSEDSSEERQGFPFLDDTAIRHNSCHSDMVQQFPFPHLLCVCVFVSVVRACMNTHVSPCVCTQAWSHGI